LSKCIQGVVPGDGGWSSKGVMENRWSKNDREKDPFSRVKGKEDKKDK